MSTASSGASRRIQIRCSPLGQQKQELISFPSIQTQIEVICDFVVEAVEKWMYVRDR
jgi:hypothetical protein